MYLEVYPDIIFILNFIIDFILLFLLKKVNRKKSKIIKLVAAAAAGSVFAVLISIYPMIPVIVRFIVMNILAAFFMIRIAFGPMKLPELIKQVVVLYIITFFVGGMLNSLYYYTDVREKLIEVGNSLVFSNLSPAYILILILCLIPITYLGLWFYRWYQSEKKDLYDVELYFKENHVHAKGLMDSGNCMYDPVFKKPVMVMENSLAIDLLPGPLCEAIKAAKQSIEGNETDKNTLSIGSTLSIESELALKLRFIPYQSIGKPKGIMLGVILDKVLIDTGKETICNERVTAAICDNHLSTKDDYHVILHKELI